MAYPADTAVETAIATIEAVLEEAPTAVSNRAAVYDWLELLRYIEAQPGTGYDALTQSSWTGLSGL